jgi:CheY-like chemotaxis protein
MDIELDEERGDEAGIDATLALKADPATAKIPVVALTGLDPDEIVGLLDVAGFVAFVHKPASIDLLKSALAVVFG